MDEKQTELERCLRQELVERMDRAIPEEGLEFPLKGVGLSRAVCSTAAVFGVSQPTFCIIAQGSKEVFLADRRHQYDEYSYLLATVELPIVSRVLEASPEKPYLGLRVNLDAATVGSVMVEMGQTPPQVTNDPKAIEVSPLCCGLLDCAVRLVRLLDAPSDAQVLLPLIQREIVYRLLLGEQGHRLRQMTVMGGHTHRISLAVQKICSEFSQPLEIESLARQAGMSVSGFHHHFKAVTAMSPLQFQKQLRLQEARRLMLGENLDAATAGYRVGYDDASHFSREYKRLFGEPPLRNVERLREAADATMSV